MGENAIDLQTLLHRCRVEDGESFDLAQHPTRIAQIKDIDKAAGKHLLRQGVKRLSALQELLYANSTWSLLLVFQAMDAGGKDGMIKHVMSGVNPQGVTVTSFKQPGPVELSHDYLWRVHLVAPSSGRIGIFNRSHYEEVLVTRVHPELLVKQKIPACLRDGAIWEERYRDIRHFEHYLSRQGTVVLKFFLNLSKEEQRKRFLRRIDLDEKHWKFSISDAREREHWDAYRDAYREAIRNTAQPSAPWFVIPADRKWMARLLVMETIIEALERLKLSVPDPAPDIVRDMAAVRQELEAQAPKAKHG
ncbi:polyphosphate kinase 2 family protein [Gluconacetobacter liquefaciens]|uniref:PPK2 family polyphosphate:nucleotide phosphotransferase n=1 Tax=Gluconacetobacter liquefaciens TaxID=89584 RepID=A0A370G6J7_GLULI|nr:polyphosphate kinase 2 family protein [Gluconacetobacter liquefaciens]MBB2186919.1 polyphosphate kinase 2 family protein [Gluconacetobacter liquefaciens]RDI37663.1 PPK2 family polyphosphate:nucleotide phosphotransferase [Gluconacetobacter liquefaciens]